MYTEDNCSFHESMNFVESVPAVAATSSISMIFLCYIGNSKQLLPWANLEC